MDADGDEIRAMASPLRERGDLDPLIERLGSARYVLLGEASHGTSEYYGWRAAVTRRLIIEHGFSFVAVEGDWPDCFRVNQWVRGRGDTGRSAVEVLGEFGTHEGLLHDTLGQDSLLMFPERRDTG